MQSKLFKMPLFLMLMVSLFFASCSKDQTSTELLPGTWEASSFMVSGQETIGTSMNAFSMNFGEYNGTEGTAVFTTTEMNGSTQVENGTYSWNDTEDVMTVVGTGDTIVFNTTVTETSMTLTGTNTSGVTYNITAAK